MAGPNLFHAICLKLVHCVTLRHTWGMHEVSSMEIESSQPCDICGDTGYAKAILTCSICFKSREHIYCMRFNLDYVPDTWHCEACQRRKMDYDGPRKFNDEEAQKLSERKKILAMRNASSEVLYVSQCVDSSSDQLALHRLTRNFVLHKVETGNDKFISVEDFCAMSSAAKPKPSSSQRYSSSQVGFFTSNYCYMPKMTSSALETDKHHSNKFVKSPNPLPSGNLVISTSEKEPTKLSQPLHDLKYLKPENLNSVTVTEKVYGRHTSDTAYHSPLNYTGPSFDGVEGKSEAESVFSGMDQYADQFDSVLYIDNVLGEEPIHALLNFSEDGASKEICLPKSGEGNVPKTPKVNYSGPVLDVQEKLYLENTKSILDKHEGEADLFMFKDVYTEKTLDAAAAHFDESEISTSKTSFKFWEQDMLSLPEVRWSWKGSFEILNNHPRLYDDLQAYPPGRVSGKAYLVSKQMPRILQFTLHPHHDVWPNNLRTDSPFDLDTALYFLPIDFCRPKEKYSGLVELMEKEDLSLQSRLDGVDLLVFTPRRLPFGAQGMNRQVYLCGVFLSSTGSHSSYGLKEKQHTVDFPLPSYGISEDSVTAHKCDGVVTDMEIDMIGRKEVESVNKSLGSNSMDACTSNLSLTSQGVHPVYKSNSAAHLHEVKQEYCDIDTSPGLFSVYSSHALREATISKHIDQVKEDYYDAFDAHPVSRPVTSTATFVGPISVPHVQMTPSGFSELLKPKQWDSSPKQSPSISNTNLVATSSFCITSILPYQLSLPSDRLNPLPSVSDDRNGHGRINVKGRVPHHQVKNRFTPEQKDKMFIFAEKAGWSIRNQEDALVQKFCEEVGISRNALKVWMYNTKHALKIHSSTACIRKPESPVKKRFKTKFTQEQKDKMWSFAEKVGWRITKQEEAEVQQFCKEVGISRRILKFWICNNKKHLKMKLSSA